MKTINNFNGGAFSSSENLHEKLIEQFFESLSYNNIRPLQSFTPEMDGELHRFAVDGDRGSEKTGAYKIYPDLIRDPFDEKKFRSWPTWFIQDHRQHNSMIKVTFNAKKLSDSEILQATNDIEAVKRREAEKIEKAKRHEEEEARAVQNALREYSDGYGMSNRFDDFNKHAYARKKFLIFNEIAYNQVHFLPRIKQSFCNGDKVKIGSLMIPLINIEALFLNAEIKFQSLQFISGTPDANEYFLRGFYKDTHAEGAGYIFCPNNFYEYPTKIINGKVQEIILYEAFQNAIAAGKIKELFICEGFATAYSLVLIKKAPVVAAMNCGNIINVAKPIKQKFPNLKIIIGADNDLKTEQKTGKNPGVEAAKKTITEGFADSIIIPPNGLNDFSDFLNSKMKGII